MLKRLDKPVHVVFFNDPMMRDTVEIYQQMARETDKLTVEFYDPMLNPAQARMRGVEFAGTAIYESEGRKMQVNGPTETDIANGIVRISQGVPADRVLSRRPWRTGPVQPGIARSFGRQSRA
jgi:hypothetical protein